MQQTRDTHMYIYIFVRIISKNKKIFFTFQKQKSILQNYVHSRQYAIMSSTSQKHQAFVAEPLGQKPVTDCAGIGKVLGEKLKDKGFEFAYNLVGQFLLFNKDVETMEELDWVTNYILERSHFFKEQKIQIQ